MRVLTADGKVLGLVKEARIDRFLVDVRWAPDYWLDMEAIEHATGDSVQLVVTKADIGTVKLHLNVTGPGLN
jgi:hypothetical protein